MVDVEQKTYASPILEWPAMTICNEVDDPTTVFKEQGLYLPENRGRGCCCCGCNAGRRSTRA